MMRWMIIFVLMLATTACGASPEPSTHELGSRPPLTSEPRTPQARATIPLPTLAGERPTSLPVQSTPITGRTAPAIQPTLIEHPTQPAPLVTPRNTVPALPTTSATPVSNYDAAQAITAFAKMMLGTEVSVLRAGGASGDLMLLPSVAAQLSSAVKLAGAVYVGALSNGAAQVALGSGSISGDLNADIQSVSLGAYSILHDEPMPKDATSAFNLAKSTYPALATLSYTQQNTQTGYMWYTVTTHPGVEPKTKTVITVAEAVLLGVMPGGARGSVVWVVVGNGTFASSIKP